MHSTTPGSDSRTPRSISPLLPVMPMAVRRDPGIGWALRPRLSIRWQTARTCSSVAWDCMTISMEGLSIREVKFTATRQSVANQATEKSRNTLILDDVTSHNGFLRCGIAQPGGKGALGLSISFVWQNHKHFRASAVFGGGVPSRRCGYLGRVAVSPQASGGVAAFRRHRPSGL